MGVLESIFFMIGRWFGYVGACMITPDATCRPFLAFVALTAAASVALTLLLLAYRAARQVEAGEAVTADKTGDTVDAPQRRRRIEPTFPRKPALQTHLHAA
jgi:hypothetical protein